LKQAKHIFYGHNILRYRTDRVLFTSLHAEIDAILKAKKTLFRKRSSMPASTIYVARIKNENHNDDYKRYTIGISMPCQDCQKKLYKLNVTKIYYTDVIDGEDTLCEMRIVENGSIR
jgi:deoxycytidylate deaminase